jgi:hypothetical protein
MGNTLLNSMVRGFGFTLGRKAANSVTSGRNQSTTQQSFSKKQLALIQENEDIKKTILDVLKETELYYTNGKITEGEYNILKSRANDQLVEVNENIDRLKSVSQSSGSVWPVLIGLVIGIYIVLWTVKIIKGN